MSLPRFLLLIGLATGICWGAWLLVLFFIDPLGSGLLGLILFFISLWLAILGTIFLIGFFLRLAAHRQEPPFHHVAISLRQSFWLASLLVLSLMLQWHGLFEWWIGVLLVIGFAVLEAFFLSRSLEQRKFRRPKPVPEEKTPSKTEPDAKKI